MIMKKGQAAMEFMMTYGWAILVVLAAIGALAAFGVFDMGSMMPDKTTFSAPFLNTESGTAQVSGPNVLISIPMTNGNTKSINITGVGVGTSSDCTIDATDAGSGAYTTAGVVYTGKIPTNAQFVVRWNCTTAKVEGEQLKSELEFDYTTDSGIEYTHTGSTSLTVVG